jgi:CRISPR system Cascade subunit CasD
MNEELRWLVLRLEAPLIAFGGVTIDQIGVTRDFPAASMLTGLIANALGWERPQWQLHQMLQDRIVFAARRERESVSGILTDTQNAQLEKNDKGWTTLGHPEGRDGNSYGGPHRRLRDYHADLSVSVVLRLHPAEVEPDLDAIAAALKRPARPLFVGRKPCLPTLPILAGEVMGASAYEALERVPPMERAIQNQRALWPVNEGPSEGDSVHRVVALEDLRNWRTGLHGGSRMVVEGVVKVGEAIKTGEANA